MRRISSRWISDSAIMLNVQIEIGKLIPRSSSQRAEDDHGADAWVTRIVIGNRAQEPLVLRGAG